MTAPKPNPRTPQVEAESIASDRSAFNDLVYTSPEQVEDILNTRKQERTDTSTNLPPILAGKTKAVLFRQLATSNYEVRRFVSLTDGLRLEPVFWEYYADKFTPNNEWKRSLGKLFFYGGKGKKDGARIVGCNVIDFNTSNGKPIREVKTTWGQSLIGFHHELFRTCFKDMRGHFFDASSWFSENGSNAHGYYKAFLTLFLRDAVLFENFMLEGEEGPFTRNVFLPAFLEIYKETGLKPLIISLEPTDIEGDRFWICHPAEDREFVERKLTSSRWQRWRSRILDLWI